MNYVVRNDEWKLTIGTSGRGVVDVSYVDLVRVFGEPHTVEEGEKTDANWIIQFEDGLVATIYNYKDGKNYLGEEGTPTQNIRDWHIGGANQEIVSRVMEMLKQNNVAVRQTYSMAG